MGFYTKARILALPNKRVIDDLLERDGLPNEESFTPYEGMHCLIAQQMTGVKFSSLGIDIIKSSVAEVQLSKLKGTSNYNDKNDESLIPTVEYALEDIDEQYFKDFVLSQLIGVKVNTTAARTAIKSINMIQPLLVDSESGSVFNKSDVRELDYMEDTHAVESDIKSKIPSLLKKLQDGSILYGVSLLSLFIAKDRAIKVLGKAIEEIRPRHLLECDIYRVNEDGVLLDCFDAETANNTPKFKNAKDVVLGLNLNDVYYKAGCELTTRMNRLGFNLHEENPEVFTPTYVHRIANSYILSNQEVLSDMSSVDPSIVKMLEDGSVFTAPDVNGNCFKNSNRVIELKEMAKRKMAMVPKLHEFLTVNSIVACSSIKPEELINEFFKVYKKVNSSSTMEETSISDCKTDFFTVCDILCNGPIIFRLDKFVLGMGCTPLFDAVYGIITDRGFVVKIDDSDDTCVVTSVASMLSYCVDYDMDKMWKRVVQL